MGSATKYDWPTIIDEVCRWLSAGGTIRSYCRQEGKPGYVAVYEHIGADEATSERIVRARARGADAIAEEALEIADDSSGDTLEPSEEGGPPRCNSEFVQRSKLRFEARMRLLSKWNSGRYGDKLEHSGEIKTSPMTPDERAARLAAILLDAGRRKGGSGATEQSGTVADGTD